MNVKAGMMSDTKTMAGRCLLLAKRNPDTILTSIVSPVLLMILFVFVLGGSMDVSNSSYVNYIVPGVILQSLGQCAATTAISVSTDIKSGIIDRFSTMPIKKSSILTGHVIEAFSRSVLAIVLVTIVAFIVGFRPEAGLVDWLIVILLLFLYSFVMSWISVFFGILANSPEGAGSFSVFAIALPYLSSGFVSIDTMPKALQVFARNQPMTPIIDTLRAALQGENVNVNTFIIAVVWCAALLIVFYVLSVRAFKKKA